MAQRRARRRGRVHTCRRRPADRCRPMVDHRVRWPTDSRSWSCRAPDRAPDSASRRRRACVEPSGCATSRSSDGLSSKAAKPTQCAKRRAIDVDAFARPASAPGGTGAGDRRISRRARRRPSASVGRPPSISRCGSRRLDDAGRHVGASSLAGPAGILRPPRHDHPVLRRDLVEPLGDDPRR